MGDASKIQSKNPRRLKANDSRIFLFFSGIKVFQFVFMLCAFGEFCEAYCSEGDQRFRWTKCLTTEIDAVWPRKRLRQKLFSHNQMTERWRPQVNCLILQSMSNG